MIQPYFQNPPRELAQDFFSEDDYRRIKEIHTSYPEYAPTPLASLPQFAHHLGIASLHVKDESKRFGLNAFKALGVSGALKIYLESHPLPSLLVSATDGNHGRAVAWQAKQLGIPAVIFMPRGSAQARVQAIASEGARVQVMDLGYDDAVRLAQVYAQVNDGLLVQDTALPGESEEIPRNIMLGYTSMVMEALEQLGPLTPTHVFLQAGVGSFAAGAAAALLHALGEKPVKLILMEAERLACIALSAKEKVWKSAPDADTVMAGLNCGEPNPIALPILLDAFDAFLPLPDRYALRGMRRLAHPFGEDPVVISGESGAIGAGLIDALCNDPEWRDAAERLEIDSSSRILLFSTEGDTDPSSYREVIHGLGE